LFGEGLTAGRLLKIVGSLNGDVQKQKKITVGQVPERLVEGV